ncbi:HAD family hydrolase [Dermacoccaceae bacterium W4C1]
MRAVLLDVDDTLLDTTAAIIAAAQQGISALWPQVAPDLRSAAAVRFRSDPGGSFGRFTRGETTFGQMRQERLGEVAGHYRLPLPPAATDDFEDAYRGTFLARQRVFADVVPFLQQCRAARLPIGALTNASGAVTQQKLAQVGGQDWFEVVVTRDTLGFGKPDPRVFAHAAAQLGAPMTQTLMVGDEFTADIAGGAAAGMPTCWVQRRRDGAPDGGPSTPHAADRLRPPVIRISSLDELDPVLLAGC